jgi:predicted permease
MENLRIFLDNLVPVFIAAGAGWLLAARLKTGAQGLSHVAFHIFSPCLIYQLVVENSIGGAQFVRVGGFAAALLLGLGAITWLLTTLLRMPRRLRAAMVLVVMLPNAGNFGLSINQLAFGDAALAQASLFFVASATLSYTVGVFVASLGRTRFQVALRGLLRVPAIWAVVIALLVVSVDAELPRPLARPIALLADASIPSFLVILGIQLRRVRWTDHWRALALATVLRLGGGMGLGFLLATPWGLEGIERQSAILQAAMPAAIINSILATEYDTEPAFVTAVIFLSTVLSPLTLTPLLALLGA